MEKMEKKWTLVNVTVILICEKTIEKTMANSRLLVPQDQEGLWDLGPCFSKNFPRQFDQDFGFRGFVRLRVRGHRIQC